jgi:large subunit ribosomal protein L7e
MVKKVPETLAKHLARSKAVEARLAEEATSAQAHLHDLEEVATQKAKHYEQEYADAVAHEATSKAAAKKDGNFWVAGQAKVALAIRIKGINKIAPKPRKILQLLRLLQLHNAVLVKLTKATSQMLHLVEPYITFGYPSRAAIKKLILKRGFAKIKKDRVPITDNLIVEQHLGKHGIVCVDDLVHEIVTAGPHFKEANNFLWPFKLSAPRKGFSVKRHSFITGGDWGNREEHIDSLVRRMV